jgi:hypothetical protein
METSLNKPDAKPVCKSPTGNKGSDEVAAPVCKHVWSRDYIDLTPDRSMPVWSCSRCHEIREERP